MDQLYLYIYPLHLGPPFLTLIPPIQVITEHGWSLHELTGVRGELAFSLFLPHEVIKKTGCLQLGREFSLRPLFKPYSSLSVVAEKQERGRPAVSKSAESVWRSEKSLKSGFLAIATTYEPCVPSKPHFFHL